MRKRNIYYPFVIFFVLSFSLYAQQPQWEIVGNQTFPKIDTKWSRGNAVSGIGQIKSIYVDSNDKNHLIIGAYGGGIWESHNVLSPDNNSVKWTCLTDDIALNTANRIIVQNDYIYASSSSKIANKYASSLFKKYGLGVVKKHKNATNWEISNFKFDCQNFDVVTVGNKTIIYAISFNEVFKSTDNGNNWERLHGFDAVLKTKKDKLQKIIINPNNPKEVFVFATTSESLIYKTTDGGKTWIDSTKIFEELIDYNFLKNSNQTLPYYDTKTKELYIALHTGAKVFIVTTKDWKNFKLYNDDNKKGFRISNMKSTSFTKIRSNDFLFGATRLHGLYNGKTSKTLSANKIHDDIRALEKYYDKKDSIIYIGHDGGIAISKDFGKTYINVSGNLNLFQSFNMAYNNHNNHRIITIGVQDGSWYRIDRDGTNRWNAITMCCEGGVFTQPNNPDITYINNKGHLIRLDDGVQHPLGKKHKIARIEDFDAPIAFHPSKPETIVLSEYKWPNSELLVSHNKGNDLIHLIIDENNKGYMRGRPSAMTYDKFDSSKFYMASLFFGKKTNTGRLVENHLYKTTNMSDTPEDIIFYDIIENIRDLDAEVLDKSPINDIEVYNDNIWACFGNIQEGKKVYYSNDAGDSWQNISYNLNYLPINNILYSSNIDKLFIGTDDGVYFLNNQKWERFGVGLPKASVTGLEIDSVSNEIIVSLYGRSVWVAPLQESYNTKSLKTTKQNVIIKKDTTWTTDRVINGDLIIEKRVRLTILNSSVTLRNIIVKKKGSLVWNGGKLTAYKSPLFSKKSKLSLQKKSCMNLKNILITDFDIEIGKKAFMEQKNLQKSNCSIEYLYNNKK